MGERRRARGEAFAMELRRRRILFAVELLKSAVALGALGAIIAAAFLFRK